MGFFDYAGKTQSNIIPQEEFQELTQEVFGVIASNLGKSLGPLGSSATILNGSMTEATKDGYAILKNYNFRNIYKKKIYNLIMAPCTRMNNTVGDGTTTAIVLTDALLKEYRLRKEYIDTLYRLPRQFTSTWDMVVSRIVDEVQKKATPINPSDHDTIYNLAYVSANGNHEIAETIAQTYMKTASPAIKKKDSPTNKSFIKEIDGFEFPANLIDEAFVRNQDLSVEEKNICVMIFDHKIETDTLRSIIIPFNDVLRAMGHKLLVIAPYYDALMCQTVLEQYLKLEMRQHSNVLNLLLSQYSLGDLNPYQLEDLAVIMRANIITEEIANEMKVDLSGASPEQFVEDILGNDTDKYYRMIGRCSTAMMTCKDGSIFKPVDIESDEQYQDVLNRARIELDRVTSETSMERQAYAHQIYDATARLNQLLMQNFIYYIGADSELQKQIIGDAVDDVIKCVKSAIKSGIVPGCQISIMQVCRDLLNDDSIKSDPLAEQIVTIIYSAVMNVYKKVLDGPEGLGIIKLIPRWQYGPSEDASEEEQNTFAAALSNEYNVKLKTIITGSIEQGMVFDLETAELSNNIVTSAETDMMVLTAASELIKILINSNQCIANDAMVDESNEHTVDAW